MIMIRVLIFLLLGSVCCSTVRSQEPVPVVEQVKVNKFRQSLLKAADAAAKAGEIKRADVVRLRVASLSPAFLAQAERLAAIQMAFSGEEVPTLEDGKIDVAKIDWDALIAFLEKLIPLILQMLDLLSTQSKDFELLV
jgi:hypothetical protein